MSKRDIAKSSAAKDAKDQVAHDDASTSAPPKKKAAGLLTRKWIRNGTTKEPPVQEVITANGTEPPVGKDLVAIALPGRKQLSQPIQTAGAVTIRSDEAPKQVETGAPDQCKADVVTLKSTHIKYGASKNYTVLVGRVQEWRKTLRLRYAAVEQDDAHGGSVELEAGVELPPLRDGQHVRVRGAMIPAEDRVSSARFRVDAIEVLD
jgi:hypothetical protein